MAKRGKKGGTKGNGPAGRKGAAANRPAPPSGKSNTTFYLILAGVAVAGIAALMLARGGAAGAPENLPVSVADMDAEASGAAGMSIGPEDAPATIIEFEDFLCPFCRQFNALTGKSLRNTYARGDDAILRWVTYDFPLHQQSWAPALAARCAADQDRYWEMHDLLFARTEDWSRAANPNGAFVDLAGELGLDTGTFRQCLSDRPHLQHVAAARKYGESIGVGGTPTLYLNGRRLSLGQEGDYETLERLIREAARPEDPNVRATEQ